MERRQGQAYSQDLRDRVLAAIGPAAAVAVRFEVSPSYVIKVRQRRDRNNSTCAGEQRSHRRAKLADHDEALRTQVSAQPDATLAELTAWVKAELGVSVSLKTLWTRLRGLALTLKKRR